MKTIALTTISALLLATTSAPGVISHSVTAIGTYTLGLGSAPIIDVYKVSFDAGFRALVLEIGTSAGLGGSDPFQAAWITTGGKGHPTLANLTPMKYDADYWLTPPDASKCYECDSFFIPTPMGTYALETNDGSIYDAGDAANEYRAGVGYLRFETAPPQDLGPQDVIKIGVVRSLIPGDGVWVKSSSADGLGHVTNDEFFIPALPEPGTTVLLAAGGLGVFPRRGRRKSERISAG